MEQIKLSFNDEKLKIASYDNKVSVSVESYIKNSRLEEYFTNAGFTQIPDCFINELKAFGFKRDYKMDAWVLHTAAIAKCNEDEDFFDNLKGVRIAKSRAKIKAYKTIKRLMLNFLKKILPLVCVLTNTTNTMSKFSVDETDALGRLIKYGYSKPNKND